MKTAVITGVAGQDGSYLAELLLEKGYNVVGILRRHSSPEHQTNRLDEYGLKGKIKLVYGDVTDLPSLLEIFSKYKPDEIYNLAAQSHVKISFNQPSYTTNTIVYGTLNVLEAARYTCPEARIYLAGSSEMYGNECDKDGLRRESTNMLPVSPYGCAKLYGYNLGRTYRESYGMYICNGILFNHESPRRGINFVTNKIISTAVDIVNYKVDKLYLGNLSATRDWGHAKDYVRAMWLMLQKDNPSDYVCATGKSYSVKYLCDLAFTKLGLNFLDYVKIDPAYFRPYELHDLRGDPSKAEHLLNWKREYSFELMVEEMVDYWRRKKNLSHRP